ncbi:unnamed protein product [Amoebophrya sp. A120]|nr:unnamed protein product [Amoebophrya sp. A120]|eukprot:GSA120T00023947001.1
MSSTVLESFFRALPTHLVSATTYVYYSSWLMLIVGVITFIACMLIKAPYGRYADSKWGYLQNPKLAWCWQESPSWWVPLLVVLHYVYTFEGTALQAFRRLHPCSIFLLLFFEAHYIQRAIIYPLCRMSPNATKVPLIVSCLAFLFCVWNGLQQSIALLYVTEFSNEFLFNTPVFRIGFTIATVGMILNIHADSILINLRRKDDSKMKTEDHGGSSATGEIEMGAAENKTPLKKRNQSGEQIKDAATPSVKSSPEKSAAAFQLKTSPDKKDLTTSSGTATTRIKTAMKSAISSASQTIQNLRRRSSSQQRVMKRSRNRSNKSPGSSHGSNGRTGGTKTPGASSSTTSAAVKKSYKIPFGGLFYFVSAANLAAEILEWFGFAMANNFSLPTVAFACYTFANIGPRGYHHHNWYLDHFGEKYKALGRKAVIPFLW